jgi:hypothetical protein
MCLIRTTRAKHPSAARTSLPARHVSPRCHDQLHIYGNLSKSQIKTKSLQWDDTEEDTPLTGLRRIGDGQTLCVEFDASFFNQEHRPSTPDGVIESTTFQLRKYDNEDYGWEQIPRYDIGCRSLFTHAICKHTYMAIVSKSVLADKIRVLKEKADSLTKLELEKLPQDQRPSTYTFYMELAPVDEGDTGIDDFAWSEEGKPIPEGWMYYDDELVEHLGKLWKKYGAEAEKAETE